MTASKVVDKSGWNYTIIENQIIETADLDIYEKMLYIALKRFANLHTQEAFPGVKMLAKYAGMSERKARDVIGFLSDKEFIHVEHRVNKTSVYTILPTPARYAGPAPDAPPPAGPAPPPLHTVQDPPAHGADELKKLELKKLELKKLKDIEQEELAQKFSRLWDLYPNKKSKDAAFKHFKKHMKEGVDFETIESGLISYVAYCTSNKWYKPAHGSTWFNNRRWEDDYSTGGNGNGVTSGHHEKARVTKTYEDGVNF